MKDFTIQVSRSYLNIWLYVSLLLFVFGIFTEGGGLGGFGIMIIIFIAPSYYQKIDIVGKDAKYSGLFKRISIKDIESVDCSGFGVFNSIKIYGRGKSLIKLKFIENYDEVRQYAENIENWK